MINNVVMEKHKKNKPIKYTLDTTWFFDLLKANNITQFEFCDYANISPSVLHRYYKGRNIETDTLLHLIEVLETMIKKEIEDKNKIFNIVKTKDKENKNK